MLARLARINFIQRSGDEIQIETAGILFFSWEVKKERYATHTIEFKASSPKEDIDTWLADDGKMFEVAIEGAIAELSSEMASTLLRLRQEKRR